MQNPFVAIEGIDGTGKTTTAELLAQELGGVYVKTPMPPFDVIRKRFDVCTPTARFLFYLVAVVDASRQIAELLSTSSVFCDRYYRTTRSYHEVMGAATSSVDFAALGILEPDFTFCLCTEEKERLRRMAERGLPPTITEDPDFLAKVDRLIAQGTIVIDTTNSPPTQVVEAIIKLTRRGPS